MTELILELRKFAGGRVFENEPMAAHTTFRVGGQADVMFFPKSAEEILFAIDYAEKRSVSYMVIGKGSNLLVRDKGIRGLVIVLGEQYSAITIDGEVIRAEAGASLARVSATACEHSLSGLEFASGIPGTLGGGCAMNAGAYGGQLSDVLVSAKVLINGEVRELSCEEMEMGYRTTRPLREGGIVLEAVFRLKNGNREEISATMKELNGRRRDKQPLNLPSAGSTFKRPEGNYAGALIEQCGLKGYRVGGAQVSEKHAGFVVNVGGACAGDILELIRNVQKTVAEQTGYHLEPEVRIVGEE